MAKYCGKIGFVVTTEVKPGVWVEQPIERQYYGDLTSNRRRLQSTENLNDNIVITNELSIVIDPFAHENFHAIRYAEFMGTKWKVNNIEVQYPRLIMTLGDVYNGKQI